MIFIDVFDSTAYIKLLKNVNFWNYFDFLSYCNPLSTYILSYKSIIVHVCTRGISLSIFIDAFSLVDKAHWADANEKDISAYGT